MILLDDMQNSGMSMLWFRTAYIVVTMTGVLYTVFIIKMPGGQYHGRVHSTMIPLIPI